jgi:DNA polymerase elongation subunit (family B)
MLSAKKLDWRYHYKFLVLLPFEADGKLEALKHYFGITYDKELITRGIETRRHDTPISSKIFKMSCFILYLTTKMLKTLLIGL